MPTPKTRNSTTREPPRHVTPPAASITPPSRHRERLLPIYDLGSRKFEELCCDLLRKAFPEAQRSSLKRKSGVAQFGVDVEGFDPRGSPFVVISSKCYAEIEGWHLSPWTKDFTKHLGSHWKDKGVRHFVLAVTHECNDDKINDAARIISAELERQGIEFRIWNSLTISELLRDDPRLVNQYFNKYWVKAISADLPVGHPSVEGNAPIGMQGWFKDSLQQFALGQIESMAGHLNAAWSHRLDDAIKELRGGRSSGIQSWVREAKATPALWQSIDAEVRAKAIRASAMAVVREGDWTQAACLLDEADELAPPPDRSARTILARVQIGLPEALSRLSEPLNGKEREIKAAFLIESGEVDDAIKVLEPAVGESVTAEILRLRAIAHFISGDRVKALNLAVSSVKMGRDDAAPYFTLAIVRFSSALADGVACQFGGSPDPISRSLLRSGPEAVRLLSQAAAGFDQLVPRLEGEFRRDVEVWKLAALLLNPETQAEARQYARALLAREELEPEVIAWCLHFGLPIRRGHIKKRLGDALRKGAGSPGHVVVLALMASRLDNPARGLAILKRFGPQFPEAAEFFAMWRMQFGEGSGSADENYSAAIRWGMSKGDNAPLLRFLTSAEASVENVMSGAEFLASRRSFQDLDALRDRLVPINTERAIELAARAANKVGKHTDCLSIIEQASGDRLPTRLVYLRLEAHEALGAHRHLISDLQRILGERDDAGLHDRLIHAYLRIGALEEAKVEAEKALASRKLDSRQAVQIAYALKNVSPETARRALEQVQGVPIPPELSGTLLSLSNILGMQTLQESMIQRMVASAEGAQGLIKFESVEDVLAFVRKQADEYRRVFAEWLSGKTPAAAAMRSDLKAFGLLFLGAQNIRKNNIGDRFPMLLLGLGHRQDAAEVEGRPEVRVDLGALLLAHRLDLLDEVDRAFRVLVPQSLPEALVELEAEYLPVSVEVAEALNTIARGDSAVRLTTTAPQDAGRLDDPDDSADSDRRAMVALLNHAFRTGHLTRSERDRASALLKLDNETDASRLPEAGLVLSRSMLIRLARMQVVEPLARSLPMYLLEADMVRLTGDMAAARAEQEVGESIARLRRTVAERLTSSRWRTVARSHPEPDEERVAYLPAHVRCLLETLPWEEGQGDNLLFWIEDRTLSKQRVPKALYLPDVLQVLVKQGILSASRYASATRVLRDAGYSFAPIDILHLASLLEQAAVVDGELIENPELAAERQWFAKEVANLAYIDPTVHLDADGTIVGETRRTLELGSLIKDLLAAIWENPDATIEQKVARSSWAWMSLRLEYVPSPPAADTPAARRQYAAMIATQAISLPLHAGLGSVKLPSKHRQVYVNWAMRFVGQMADADPDLRDDIEMLLAGMALRLLDDPTNVEDDLLDSLRAHMRKVVHDFLGLLPDDWYDRIADRDGIGDKLGRKKVVTLEIGESTQIRTSDLANAILHACEGTGRARMPLHNGDGDCILEMARNAEEEPGAVLVVGKRRLPLHPTTIALVHPDPDVRARLAHVLREEALDRPLSDRFLQELAAEPDVDRRVEAFTEARGGAFRRSLEIARERLQAGEPVRLNDLDLPEPSVLLEFIGLPADFSGDCEQLSVGASESLARSIGAVSTAERLSSLPCRLPDWLLRSYAENAGSTDTKLTWDSALWAFFRFLAREAAGIEQEPETVERVAGLLESSGALFAALVRHGARQAARDPHWSMLPVDTVVCLVWLYADQHCRLLATAGLDIPSFGRWLSLNNPATLRDFQQQKNWPRWARSYALRLSTARFDAAFAAEMLRRDVEVSPKLKALAGIESNEAWFPRPEVAGAAVGAPDCIWTAADPVPAFLKAGWLPADSPLAPRTDTEIVGRIIREAAEGDSAVLAPAVSLMAEIGALGDGVLEELRQALDERLGKNSTDRSEPAHHALLEVTAEVYGIQQDVAGFISTVRAIAASNARIWPNSRVGLQQEDGPGRAFVALANAAYVFATACGSPSVETMRCFATGIEVIAEAWPNANMAAIACLDGVIRQLDVPTAAAAIWPILMTLRSHP